MDRVTVVIFRPDTAAQVFTIVGCEWGKQRICHIFPDGGMDRCSSDFPHSGISLFFNHRHHFVLANDHKERWMFRETRVAQFDLGIFSPEWSGCLATVYRDFT